MRGKSTRYSIPERFIGEINIEKPGSALSISISFMILSLYYEQMMNARKMHRRTGI
jgi:hypothetical protein